MNNTSRNPVPAGSMETRLFVPGAAAMLRARGLPVSARSVGHLARLARSFVREGMGRFEALQAAATLSVRRQ